MKTVKTPKPMGDDNQAITVMKLVIQHLKRKQGNGQKLTRIEKNMLSDYTEYLEIVEL